jgi:carbon monoxide dehydrogenase subunit G
MIEAEHTLLVDVPITRVWDYVVNIRNWAELMPGLRDCDIIDENDSRWTLKIGVGGMVRTVNVAVHVDEWDGPERAVFSYRLEGDPVDGGGAYKAVPKGPDQTEITLSVRVVGSGPVAPMWEALGRPVLPQFVKAFASQLKARIEEASGAAKPAAAAAPLPFAAIIRWLRKLWQAIFGPANR